MPERGQARGELLGSVAMMAGGIVEHRGGTELLYSQVTARAWSSEGGAVG